MCPFTPLGDTLHDNPDNNASQKKQLESAEIIDITNNTLKDMFGEELSKHANPLFLKNRTITISCSNSAIAKEIRSNQQEIVAKINEKLGKNEVDRIRYLA